MMEDEWQYHQDGRDMAVEMGGRLLIGMAVLAVACGVWALFEGCDPLTAVGVALFMFVAMFGIACII